MYMVDLISEVEFVELTKKDVVGYETTAQSEKWLL